MSLLAIITGHGVTSDVMEGFCSHEEDNELSIDLGEAEDSARVTVPRTALERGALVNECPSDRHQMRHGPFQKVEFCCTP